MPPSASPCREERKSSFAGISFYSIRDSGNIAGINDKNESTLKRLFSTIKLDDLLPRLEGQYVGLYVDETAGTVQIFSDRYARCDIFRASNGRQFYLSTDLDFIFRHVRPVYDQEMLAHLFCVYGWYTPKGLTIYKNVGQLRVGEILTLSGRGIDSRSIAFKPQPVHRGTVDDLENYFEALRDSVMTRACGREEIWVSSSSGWDSSILLGLLVKELGPRRVRMLTGSMKYSTGTAVINRYEMEKIKAIGRFYGIKPTVVDLDFKSTGAPAYWEKIAPFFKSRHVYTYTIFNFSRLSDGLEKIAGKGQVIFNGETSDSFHNFGFSQFVTFFHTKKAFTEYGDKMNCYLYGPSFFKKVLEGDFERDKVYQIFQKMAGNTSFTSGIRDRQARVESYLFPFFYGSPRIPFARTYENALLSEKGRTAVYRFPFRRYMPEILTDMNEKTLYSWLIYLYHSFHSQGSTVSIQKHAMEMNEHHWRSPFNDYRVIDALSQAPEEWGRGLELNHTKYPLKWVAQNKIPFPYETLEEGPHSYLYDVIEGFSLLAEVTYRSGMTGYFRDSLRNRPYRDILDDAYFDLPYMDDLVARFVNGKEVPGKDFNNLVSLITLCSTGWY